MDGLVKKSLDARIKANIEQIQSLQIEISALQQSYNVESLTNFEGKWNEICIWINAFLERHYKYLKHHKPVLFSDCKLHLRVQLHSMAQLSEKYRWELHLPMEVVGGQHWKVIDLTFDCALLPRDQCDFLTYLIDNTYIYKYVIML